MDNRCPRLMFYLGLCFEDVDPEVVTRRLGIEPTQAWKKGEPRPFGKGNYGFGSWQFGTEREFVYDLNNLIERVYNVLLPVKKELKDLIATHDMTATFESVIEMYDGQTPALYLKKYIIDFAAEMNITFDFDSYIMSSSEEREALPKRSQTSGVVRKNRKAH